MDPTLRPQAAAELSPSGELRWQRRQPADVQAKAELSPTGELQWDIKPMCAWMRKTLFNYAGSLRTHWMQLIDHQKWGVNWDFLGHITEPDDPEEPLACDAHGEISKEEWEKWEGCPGCASEEWNAYAEESEWDERRAQNA